MLYTDNGAGKCVVFLHGWGGGLASFSFAAHCLESRFRVINLEFDHPKQGEVFGIKDYCDSVLKLLDSLNVQTFSVVGHSFGGRAAIYLAANHGDRINSVVLVSAAGIKPRRGIKYRLSVAKYKRLKKKGADTSKLGSKDYRALPAHVKPTFVRIVSEDLTSLLPKISAPTLIIYGKTDRETPPYMAKRMHKGIANSGIVALSGGHYAYVEEYNRFVRILQSFFGG